MKLEENEIKFTSIDDLKEQSKKLAAALKCGQSVARARTLNSQETIERVKSMIEKMSSLVPKSYGTNAKIIYIEGAGVFPNCYKYTPEGTKLELTKHTNYYILTVSRDNCNKWAYENYDYLINIDNCKKEDEIKQHIIKEAIEQLGTKNNVNLNNLL